VSIVFQIKKGFLRPTVQAGLALTIIASLSACDEQTPPFDSTPVRLAHAAPAAEQADIPTIVVTASRKQKKTAT
jgi:hypothetical protein